LKYLIFTSLGDIIGDVDTGADDVDIGAYDIDDILLPSNILFAKFNICGLKATKYASSDTDIFSSTDKLGLHKCKI
jgi:hypothetical protein